MNNKFITIGLLSSLLGILAKSAYREFIYVNNFVDFGIADSLPSFLFVVGTTFIGLTFIENKKEKKVVGMISFITVGALLYELEQIFTPMSFDIKDVVATILGGLVSLFLYKYILKKYQAKTL